MKNKKALLITQVVFPMEIFAQEKTNVLYSGLLNPIARDILAIIGFISIVIKVLKTIASSFKSGRIRQIYSKYFLRVLINNAYNREDKNKIIEYLEELAITKLLSSNSEQIEIAIKTIEKMPASKKIFDCIILLLSTDLAKDTRKDLICLLSIHGTY